MTQVAIVLDHDFLAVEDVGLQLRPADRHDGSVGQGDQPTLIFGPPAQSPATAACALSSGSAFVGRLEKIPPEETRAEGESK
jgi:hypothetical protein